MANTPPRPPISERPNEELLEDLCRELRSVAVSESEWPTGQLVVAHVQEVCALHAELSARQVDFQARLEILSHESQWQIPALLADCLAYPQRLPYVREPDGLRRKLRCTRCQSAERHPDAQLFWFCPACLRLTLEAVQKRTPIPGLLLFRTYNPEVRCAHADADTVLACEEAYYPEEFFGTCEQCIRAEIERQTT